MQETWINLIAPRFGLILNFIGTALVAFSIGSIPDSMGYTNDKTGKDYSVAFVRFPWMFRVGMLLIAIGFLIQMI